MHTRPPENPTEDRLIGQLDRGIHLSRDVDEMARIISQMQARQKQRLAALIAKKGAK